VSTATLPKSIVLSNDVVLLHDVSWDEYRRYRDSQENRGVRMYYADGDLLLMTTGALHERLSRLISIALLMWADVSEADILSVGHWTLKEDLKQKGLEADDCYYISHLPKVRGKRELDLKTDPPPDLAIEIDVTTHSQHKFGIYAALGVPEVWIWKDDALQPHRLTGGSYEPSSDSHELRGFPFDEASALMLDLVMQDDVTAMRAFRSLFSGQVNS
jgi:Uma2 family endonuclease